MWSVPFFGGSRRDHAFDLTDKQTDRQRVGKGPRGVLIKDDGTGDDFFFGVQCVDSALVQRCVGVVGRDCTVTIIIDDCTLCLDAHTTAAASTATTTAADPDLRGRAR